MQINFLLSKLAVYLINHLNKNKMALNKNSIKAEVKKAFPNVDIVEISFFKFGIFCIRVKEEKARSTKFGTLMGESDFDKAKNGVVLDAKINW